MWGTINVKGTSENMQGLKIWEKSRTGGRQNLEKKHIDFTG